MTPRTVVVMLIFLCLLAGPALPAAAAQDPSTVGAPMDRCSVLVVGDSPPFVDPHPECIPPP